MAHTITETSETSPRYPSASRTLEAHRLAQGERPTALSDHVERWITNGILTGIFGALIISVFFGIADLVNGTPLRTPAALGSAVFLQERLAADAAIPYALVLAYTVLHGAIFVLIGLGTAFSLLQLHRRLGPLFGLALAAIVFLVLDVLFLAFLWTFAPHLVPEFGIGRIATANMLAAGGMSAFILELCLPRTATASRMPAPHHV